ncbi:hypothetical protein B0T17DRAFT_506443 [Bombardia bombarda]|uniref:Hikeshi-like domain-containing protein n=1 Tax=Bombardia bombarda TaxID=252184 RepID=A0AA40C8Z3_9PEZI|nr:hypothetical protein B0T17DRAFT_506443 [Bombardia bombarda]
MSQPLFGLVPAGQPVIVTPSETPSPTTFLYSIPSPAKTFSHIVVFLLPGVALPDGTAAAIYLITPPAPGQAQPNSKFLGGVGLGKESAIFKLGGNGQGQDTSVVLGIGIEPAESVAARMASLSSSASASSSALVPVNQSQNQSRTGGPTTLVLAQRIIKNAFNFLASFSGTAGQVEVVPLKAFEDWWRKFEGKVRTDPGFLERDD